MALGLPVKAAHLIRGLHSERSACDWLRLRGLRLITRNFSCSVGELDLVMLDLLKEPQCLVIVEVRYRRTHQFGGALESVSRGKQLRIARTTELFLQNNLQFAQHPLRFDVVAITGTGADKQFDWRRNAFCFDNE